jgi:CHAT domain-containing protein
VDDQGTSLLMSKLYSLLRERKISKVEALRQAQLSLLNSQEFSHPFFWAPFILVGNWL